MIRLLIIGITILASIILAFSYMMYKITPKQSCINGYVHEEFVSESFIRKTSQECTKIAEE